MKLIFSVLFLLLRLSVQNAEPFSRYLQKVQQLE
jgi:hypothetical protein